MTQVNDNTNSRAGKHLTYEERVKIEGYKELGYSNRAIARILNRAPQTINNAVNQGTVRSEEHTSELQSRGHLVCRHSRFPLCPYTTLFRSPIDIGVNSHDTSK